jgi:four helix bundle protein
MDLVDNTYRLSKLFPKDEMYGLTSQIRRSAVSIPSNIAEGSERNSKKEFQQFLAVAYGSLAELETQFEIAYRQGYLNQESLSQIFLITAEVGRMINGLTNSLDRKLPTANRQLQEA